MVVTLANWLVIEPASTRIMFERYNKENSPTRDSAEIKQLYKQFSKLHGISSSLNLVALVGAFAHAWWLASRLSFAV